MRKVRQVACVVFDIGGVLARIRHHWDDCLRAAGVKGFDPKSAPLPLQDFPLFDPFQKGLVGSDEYLRCLGAFLGVGIEIAARAHDAILVEPFGGTEAIVDALHEAGVLTGCLSNTNCLHWAVLDSRERFPNVAKLRRKAVSHELGLLKPDPRIYAKFGEIVGSNVGRIVFFEDQLSSVLAAREAGWDGVLVEPSTPPAPQIRRALEERGLH